MAKKGFGYVRQRHVGPIFQIGRAARCCGMGRSLVVHALVVAAVLGAPASLATAAPVTIPGSPLRVTLYDNGALDAQYAGSPWHELNSNPPYMLAGPTFYPFAEAAPFGVRGNPVATVSAPALSGSGTEADPYVATVETEPTFAVTGVRVSESVSYIDGDEQVMLRTTLHNTGATSRQIRATQMGAPMHGPSLDGFGAAGIEDGHRYVAGISDEQGSYAAMVEVPSSPWNTFAEGDPNEIALNQIMIHMWDLAGLFDDLVDDSMHDDMLAVDFAAGVQDPIPAGGSASYDVVWQFGRFDALTLTEPSGSRLAGSSVSVPVTARNHGDALAGRTVRYTVTGANPTSGTVGTSASGAATIAWTGTRAGTDQLHAFIDDDGDGIEQQGEAADEISVTFDALPAPPATPVATRTGASLRPSNAFSILTPKHNTRSGAVTLRFRLPGPGVLRGVVTSKARSAHKTSTLTVARFTRTATKAGVITVKLTPSRRAMRRLRERRRLAVSLRATFTPTGGTARTVTRAFTLRLARR